MSKCTKPVVDTNYAPDVCFTNVECTLIKLLFHDILAYL